MRLYSAVRWALAACLLAVAPLASPQDTPAGPGSTTFRARTNLVLVPVVVTDASGKYVRNLKQEDFVVREDGKEQKLAVFEPMLAASTPPPKRAEPTATEFTNSFVDQGKPGHLIILALDTISTTLEDQGYARAELMRFVQSAKPGAPMALVSLRRSEVKLLHDFTTDPKELVSALEKDSRLPPLLQHNDVEEVEKLRAELERCEACTSTRIDKLDSSGQPCSAADKTCNIKFLIASLKSAQNHLALLRKTAAMETLDGFQQLAHAFAGVAGRKSLIWATAGFPFTLGTAEMAVRRDWFADQGLLDIYPWYQRTWQVLNNANMALYPVDARGLVNPLYSSPRSALKVNAESVASAAAGHNDTIATMQFFAQMTGGVPFYNRNDLDAAFAGATEDTASYYLLGYYRSSKEAKPGWRKLKVEVKTPSLRVRARSGFFDDDKFVTSEAGRKGDIELAMRSPLDYTGLRLGVVTRGTESQGAKRRVTFRVKLNDASVLDGANDNHFVLHYAGAASTEDGKPVAQFSHVLEGKLSPENARLVPTIGLYYDVPLDLPPGKYTVRFVVRDNLRGVLGSASGPFTVD